MKYIELTLFIYLSYLFSSCLQIDYTGDDTSSPCYNCAKNFSWNNTKSCTCTIPFQLDQPYEVRCIQDYSPAAASLIKLTFTHLSLNQTEQRLHVLWPLQLLPKSQTLREVKRWQPAERKHRFPQGRSFISNGKQEKESELISRTKCFRSQTKKTTRENGFKCS